MFENVAAAGLHGSSATLLVILLTVIFGGMVPLSYFAGKQAWKANGPKHTRATPAPPGADTACLSIARSWNPLLGGEAAFRVIMDDHEIALLVPGRTRSARVAAGPHDLHVEAHGRQVSERLHLDLQPGEEVRLRCSPGAPRAGGWLWVRLARDD